MLSRKKERKYVVGIYVLMSVMMVVPMLFLDLYGTTLVNLVSLLALIYIFYSLYKLKVNGSLVSPTSKSLFLLFVLVSFLILVRTHWGSGINSFLLLLVNKKTILPYVIPFVILLLPNAKYLNQILKVFFYTSLLVIPVWLLNTDILIQEGFAGEHVGNYVPYFAVFLLGFSFLFNKRQNILIYVISIVYLGLMILNARRNVSLCLVVYMLFAYFTITRINAQKSSFRAVVIVAIFLIIIFVAAIYWNSLMEGLFSNLNSRLHDDTREGVNKLFLLDFMNSSYMDWIIGRGASGGYAQPVYNSETGEYSALRDGIETGYYHFLLKGGLLYIFVIISYVLEALKNAWRSHRAILYYLGLIMLYSFIDFYATTSISEFTPRLIIFWLCISMLCTNNYQEYINKNKIR